MTDQPGRYGYHKDHSPPIKECGQPETVGPPDEVPDWLHTVNPDPTNCHFVEVVQEPAPGHGNQIVLLIAACTCGWRSGSHQVYLGASTAWAEERAKHQLENAGIVHVRSLTSPLS